jgi:excisionase family DNA binding protein
LAYSPREISTETSIPYESVLALIHTGELHAVKRGNRYVVPTWAIDRYLGVPDPREAPDP